MPEYFLRSRPFLSPREEYTALIACHGVRIILRAKEDRRERLATESRENKPAGNTPILKYT